MNAENSIHVGGRTLEGVRHICAFFHTKEEEYAVLLDFIKEGIERKDRGVHITNAKDHDSHRARLKKEGVDVGQAENSGQLKIAAWEDAYLQDGYFDQDRQIKLLESILQEGKQQGFQLTRLIANMEWALEK